LRADDAAPMTVPGARSTWCDPRSGETEETTFLEVDGARIIAFLHVPRGPVRAGVLLCGSLYEDLQVNYRRELLLARELAGRGMATVRFHYRGTGNSDGLSSGPVTLRSLVEDARAAESWLRQRTGVADIAFYGAKLGALVCAALADGAGQAPTVLCAPALSGADYFRAMSRAGRVARVRAQRATGGQTGDMGATGARDSFVEILGHKVYTASLEDLRPRQLELAPVKGRHVLMIQIAASEALTKPYEALAERLREGGAELDVLRVQARQVWFLPDTWEPEDEKPELRALITGISDWLETATGRSA